MTSSRLNLKSFERLVIFFFFFSKIGHILQCITKCISIPPKSIKKCVLSVAEMRDQEQKLKHDSVSFASRISV